VLRILYGTKKGRERERERERNYMTRDIVLYAKISLQISGKNIYIAFLENFA